MQFQYNSDYPGLSDGSSSDASPQYAPTPAAQPLQFPPAHPLPCARITTRVYHPTRNQVATVQNVLVRTGGGGATSNAGAIPSNSHPMVSPSPPIHNHNSHSDHHDHMSSSSSSLNTTDSSMMTDDDLLLTPRSTRAYWLQRTIRDAIYGRVVFALVLIPMTYATNMGETADWVVTSQQVAVKEMSWQHIRRERDRLAEDPITEVAAMQYLMETVTPTHNDSFDNDSAVQDSLKAVLETNIMMPLDLLSDDGHLYSIMPYCNGGELFERLDMNEKFSEDEARYWMAQILNGVENLQNAGICHRDISLENLLVHETGALIIDLGMCLRVPHYDDASQQLTTDMGNMTMETTPIDGSNADYLNLTVTTKRSHRRKPRYLIQPQGTCGKWIYMSPEIYKNNEPFDGYAVDMWAAGVILFLMLTGFPPWERACLSDERFKYMTAGYLVQMLTEWNLGLSADAMDLLQRMLFLDPKDRLSLDQVRNHPWMVAGFRTPPRR